MGRGREGKVRRVGEDMPTTYFSHLHLCSKREAPTSKLRRPPLQQPPKPPHPAKTLLHPSAAVATASSKVLYHNKAMWPRDWQCSKKVEPTGQHAQQTVP